MLQLRKREKKKGPEQIQSKEMCEKQLHRLVLEQHHGCRSPIGFGYKQFKKSENPIILRTHDIPSPHLVNICVAVNFHFEDAAALGPA